MRATDCAGHPTVGASLPAKLCCAAPDGGRVGLTTFGGEVLRVTSNSSALYARSRGFSEECAGVDTLSVELHELVNGGGVVLWTSVADPDTASFGTAEIEAVVGALEHGSTYRLRAVTTSAAGHVAEATYDFNVDLTPPTPAPIVIATAESWQIPKALRKPRPRRWAASSGGARSNTTGKMPVALGASWAGFGDGGSGMHTRCASAPMTRPTRTAAPTWG